ncbi:hypothetical protein [Streptomyces cahuitamycinicus]|uniref:hypothetical protein n=1 Tax=Streptomyces cahuitamycinicus TaxID=2070367 RepID=UPI0026D2A1F6
MPDGEVALELAALRRALEVGLARIDGQLALIAQRSDQIDKAVEELGDKSLPSNAPAGPCRPSEY